MDSLKRIAKDLQRMLNPREKIVKTESVGEVQIQEMDASQLPVAMINYLQNRFKNYELSGYTVTYDHVVKVQTGGPVETYAVVYTSPNDEKFSKGRGIISIDIYHDSLVGDGRVWLAMEEEGELYRDQPFIEWTSTEKNFTRKGLALRRLHILNKLSVQYLGYPVRSSFLISVDAAAVWKKLHAQGLTEEIPLSFSHAELGNPAEAVYRFRE